MGLKCGIVGLPNVGKSTLFNALTKSEIEAQNYPFCTIEPNLGMVNVPDPTLVNIGKIAKSQKIVPTLMEFVDIAGLVKGASQGEGLGNQFLSHIRSVDAIAHVVRCFEDENITHVEGEINPINDIETIETELALADIETLEKAKIKIQKLAKTGNKTAINDINTIEEMITTLNTSSTLIGLCEEKDNVFEMAKRYQLLTAKPFFTLPIFQNLMIYPTTNIIKHCANMHYPSTPMLSQYAPPSKLNLQPLKKKNNKPYSKIWGWMNQALIKSFVKATKSLDLSLFTPKVPKKHEPGH